MKILITGAGGFVGPHLIDELVAAGHECLAVDRSPSSEASRITMYQLDLMDRDSLDDLLAMEKPGAIIHLAGWSHVGQSWNHPGDVYTANTVLSVKIYEATSRILGEKARFIQISSGDVYTPEGAGELPLNEDSPTRPESPYAASKLATEQVLGLLHRRGGAGLVIVRPFNHIGPGQGKGFALPSFARQVVAIGNGDNKPLRHGNLSTRRDFTDVRDIVRAYRLIVEAADPSPLYIAASGRSISMEDMVRRLFALAGQEPRMEADPGLFRPIDTPELRGDASRLYKELGWKPEIPLDRTLRDILDEARRQQAALKGT
ncbi:MAG: GDP-mannose 4,6-dehydratase [Candidatus Sumerlaeia bacterium]|nr:GDP-mannose 4,6-dehydratase [Candidatus Sumerlaeia bacterium]